MWEIPAQLMSNSTWTCEQLPVRVRQEDSLSTVRWSWKPSSAWVHKYHPPRSSSNLHGCRPSPPLHWHHCCILTSDPTHFLVKLQNEIKKTTPEHMSRPKACVNWIHVSNNLNLTPLDGRFHTSKHTIWIRGNVTSFLTCSSTRSCSRRLHCKYTRCTN